MQPALLVHADWSVSAAKRWMACARWTSAGYQVDAPELVGDLTTWLPRLRSRAGPQACILAGFDFPIGLPEHYAVRAGIADFLAWLPQLGQGEWSAFDQVAELPHQISLKRPFYPARPGHARQAHLLAALGAAHMDALRRRCEQAHAGRRAAAPLFWTMGGQQVGKAALYGWREVLLPARTSLEAAIWPFSGRLVELIRPGELILAEIYPAEFYTHLGVAFARNRPAGRLSGGPEFVPGAPEFVLGSSAAPLGGKRSQTARQAQAVALFEWQARSGASFTPALQQALRDGFGAGPEGEDCFDALIGVLGMLNILGGFRPLWEPQAAVLRQVEGWIFGQADTQREMVR